MPRGGRRHNAGMAALPAAVHVLTGRHRPDRHGPRPATAAPIPAPDAEAAPEWTPTEADRARLSPGAGLWLDAVLALYQLNALDGLKLLAALGTLSRVERLEGAGSSPALTREWRTFLQQWASLDLAR